jgi:hypothetical protein
MPAPPLRCVVVARPAICSCTLQASRRKALLAEDLYNRAVAGRSLEGFVMRMYVAWLYLVRARLAPDGVDYRCRKKSGHFERVDGDKIKTWESRRGPPRSCRRVNRLRPSGPVPRLPVHSNGTALVPLTWAGRDG